MLIFDLEADNLLTKVTTIHCLVIYDTEDETTTIYNDIEEPISRGVTYLSDAKCICGHNIIGYDIPVLKKLFGFFDPQGEVVDTLLLSKLFHPDLLKKDANSKLDKKLWGKHSLKAWGHRLGEYKGDFGETTDWKEWSKEMQDYCVQDVVVTTKLCNHFAPYLNGSD